MEGRSIELFFGAILGGSALLLMAGWIINRFRRRSEPPAERPAHHRYPKPARRSEEMAHPQV